METHERFLGARAFCKRITIRPFLPAQLPNSHFGRQGKNEKDKWGGMRGLFQACARADGVLYRNKSTRVVKNRRRRQRAPARSLSAGALSYYLALRMQQPTSLRRERRGEEGKEGREGREADSGSGNNILCVQEPKALTKVPPQFPSRKNPSVSFISVQPQREECRARRDARRSPTICHECGMGNEYERAPTLRAKKCLVHAWVHVSTYTAKLFRGHYYMCEE